MQLPNGLGHLSYSTLVHAGDTWEEMSQSLVSFVPRVKAAVAPDEPFAVSLRLSGASAARLTADDVARRQLAETLHRHDLYLYTVNAFPHGPFKGRLVKEAVYEPDWQSSERLEYTKRVADILAEVAPPEVQPSIQSAPIGFRPRFADRERVAAATANVIAAVAHLVELRERTGRTVTLALEPEPYCYLESTSETIAYFSSEIRSPAALEALSAASGLDEVACGEALTRHLGVVFDIGHQSVGFEDIPAALEQLTRAGVPIFKLQQASALWIPEVDDAAIAELERYAGSIYLTQTTERSEGGTRRFLNLEDAIASYRDRPGPREWRIHFHVPVFLETLGPFRSTRDNVAEALAAHRATRLSTHLEIETYTWDVLPDHLKTGDIVDYVVRELEWVRGELAATLSTPPAGIAASGSPGTPGSLSAQR